MHHGAHDAGRLGEGFFSRRLIAVLVIHREIVGHIGMQRRSTGRERIPRISHRGQITVFDDQLFGGILCFGFSLRDHQRNGLTDEPDPAVRERRPMRVLQFGAALALEEHERPRALEAGTGKVLPRQHSKHTG